MERWKKGFIAARPPRGKEMLVSVALHVR